MNIINLNIFKLLIFINEKYYYNFIFIQFLIIDLVLCQTFTYNWIQNKKYFSIFHTHVSYTSSHIKNPYPECLRYGFVKKVNFTIKYGLGTKFITKKIVLEFLRER